LSFETKKKRMIKTNLQTLKAPFRGLGVELEGSEEESRGGIEV
jgi:hypothetical protein